jgi:tetratricopeptide (TPR) repeat protein
MAASSRTCAAALAVGILLLLGSTILAYQPVWHGGWGWEDDIYVKDNRLLTAPDGLWRIWFSQDSPSQYFPLVYTAFRLERSLWGLNPAGYHWVNILMHGCSALLLWRILFRLKVPGAWLGAAFFALHPVQVESVAWISERKNVQSLFFYLLALASWVEFVGEKERRRWIWYGAGLACFALALFSKTTACTLPAAFLLVLWWKSQSIDKDRIFQVVPFLLLGLAMGLVTMWWERYHIGTTGGGAFALGPIERLLIASRGFWFYTWKLLWPANLTFSYPRWTFTAADPAAYVWLGLCLGLCAVIFFIRPRAGRGPEVAMAFYVATLAPMSGLIMLFTFQYTYVADHYQYAACIGPLALAAAALTAGLNRLPRTKLTTTISGALLVISLAGLTWRQARAHKDLESLWSDTVRKNPGSLLAHRNLGRVLISLGRLDDAIDQYRQGVAIDGTDLNSLIGLGNALVARGRDQEAGDWYRKALAINDNNAEAHVNLAVVLATMGRVDEAIFHDRRAIEINPKDFTAHVNLGVALAGKGQLQEAMDHYNIALQYNPNHTLTQINLAMVLQAMGRVEEAREHYRIAAFSLSQMGDALALERRFNEAAARYRESLKFDPNNARTHYILGIALARGGSPDEARAQFTEALRLKPDYSEARDRLRELDSRKSPASK